MLHLRLMIDLRRSLSGGSILTSGGATNLVVLSVERYSCGEVVVVVVVWRAMHLVALSAERSFCQQGRVVVWLCRKAASKVSARELSGCASRQQFTSSSRRYVTFTTWRVELERHLPAITLPIQIGVDIVACEGRPLEQMSLVKGDSAPK